MTQETYKGGELELLAAEIYGTLSARYPLCCASDEFYYFPHFKPDKIQWQQWDRLSSESVEETASFLSSVHSKLELISDNTNDKNELIDINLLDKFITTLREQLTDIRTWETQPSLYLTLACFGLEEAMQSEDPAAIHDRAAGLPVFLEQAARNLNHVPELYRDIGLEMIRHTRLFLSALQPKVNELAFAYSALDNFESVLRHSGSSAPLGFSTSTLNRILSCHIGLQMELQEVKEILRDEMQQMEAVLAKEARDLQDQYLKGSETDHSWKAAYYQVSNPDLQAINKTCLYAREVDRLLKTCVHNEIVPLNIDSVCPVEVRPTPGYLSAIRSASSYSISPDQPPVSGSFFVFDDLGYDRKSRENLREYRMLAAHETYPGHHLLDSCRLCLAPVNRRPVEQPLFYEGWACFAEELVFQLGHFDQPADRLILAKRRYWRAARGLAAIGLITRQMSLLEAGEFLKKTGIPVERALSSVRKYSLNPEYQVCYAAGMLRFLDLYRKYGLNHTPAFARHILLQGEINLNDLEESLELADFS